jgi:hypothetical protein
MASSTRATISSETVACRLITRETVLMLTRASTATSFIVESHCRVRQRQPPISRGGARLLDCFEEPNSFSFFTVYLRVVGRGSDISTLLKILSVPKRSSRC